jgi:hypothetical protein
MDKYILLVSSNEQTFNLITIENRNAISHFIACNLNSLTKNFEIVGKSIDFEEFSVLTTGQPTFW